MKYLILLTFMIVLPTHGSTQNFIAILSEECSNTKSIVIKKATIEIMKDGLSCEGTFTSLLINKCPEISCSQLESIAEETIFQKKGAIIGD